MREKTTDFANTYLSFFLHLHFSHPWDYVAHFFVSFAGVGILFLILFWALKAFSVPHKEIIAGTLAVAIMAAIGIAKEVHDSNLGRTDMAGDLAGDFLGIGTAVLLIFLVMKITR